MGLERPQEQARLSALASHDIMGRGAEASFDRIVQLAAHACRCPIALISLIDERRQWFKARVGLDIEETPRDIAFCAHAVQSGETLVVEDAV